MAALTIVLVVVGLVVAYVLWELLVHRPSYGDFNKLPGPMALPLIGNTYMLPEDRTQIEKVGAELRDRYQGKYGVYRMWLAHIPELHVGDPDVIQRIIGSSKHNAKGFLYKMLYPWLGRGLLTSEGDLWHARRHLLTPTFHFSILTEFAEVMNTHVDVFVRVLERHADTGKAIDIFHYITRCALDIIMETAMGVGIDSQTSEVEPEYVKAVYAMSEELLTRVKKPWLLIESILALSAEGRLEKERLRVLHGFTEKVIKERRQTMDMGEVQSKRRKAFLDLILTAKSPDGSMLTDSEIREEVDTFMFEGHDTTSAAVAWCLYLIARHPEVQRRLHEEIDEVLGDCESISNEQAAQLKYLEMVNKEALRLKPSVPFIIRKLSEPLQIGDITVAAGVSAVIRIWELHRDPKYWDNPEIFDPDRWTTERSKPYHVYQYIPFSAGPRNCIGQKFAQMEEKIMIAKLLKHYRIECDKSHIGGKPELVLRPVPDVPLRLYKR